MLIKILYKLKFVVFWILWNALSWLFFTEKPLYTVFIKNKTAISDLSGMEQIRYCVLGMPQELWWNLRYLLHMIHTPSGVSTELLNLAYCNCFLSFQGSISSHVWHIFLCNCSVSNISNPSVENSSGFKNQWRVYDI